MSSYTRRVLTVKSEVPYGTLLYGFTRVHPIGLDKFIAYSRRYERSYLAWEAVRKVRNPYFIDGTGFEGYFVGLGLSDEEVIARVLDLGRTMLANNLRLYRFNPAFRSRLMKTIRGEISDPAAIGVWAAQFGAAVGRLRCNLLTNSQTRLFQSETYLSTSSLPPIRYAVCGFTIEQTYALPNGGAPVKPAPRMRLDLSLKPADAEAYLVVKAIGKFGHPLIRAYLDERTTAFFGI